MLNMPNFIRCLKDNTVMSLIPEGYFCRGTSNKTIEILVRDFGADTKWFEDEKPHRKIYLSEFYIDIYPITNRKYFNFRRLNNMKISSSLLKRFQLRPYHPVTHIEWDDAVTYCEWVGRRLPTEAEWEKAARGNDDRIFPWGNSLELSRANFNTRLGKTSPVGTFPDGISQYGLHDMAGNVYEWVNDWYDKNYYAISPEIDPPGPKDGSSHVLRGGAWINVPTMIRCSKRDHLRYPYLNSKFIGFRTAISLAYSDIDSNLYEPL